MRGDVHGTSCEPQLFFGAVPRCARQKAPASAKQNRLTKHELEEQEKRNEPATESDHQASGPSGKTQKVRQPWQTKAGEEASKRQANLQKERHKRLYRKAGFMV